MNILLYYVGFISNIIFNMFLISLFPVYMLAVIIVYIFQCIHIGQSIVVSNNNNNNLHVNSIGNRIADRQMHIYMNCELQYSPIHNQLENGTTGRKISIGFK